METDLRELRAVQKMNRAERKAMADSRAMEEQMERENPLSGRGATPSMGLSQVRGGKKMMMDAGAQGKHLMEHLESLHGSGYAEAFHKGMGKHRKNDSDSDEEMSGGLRTGQYEGQGFSRDTQDFSGHMKGGFLGMLASVGIPLLMNLLGKGKMTQDAHDKLKKMFMKSDKMEGSGRVVGGMMHMTPIMNANPMLLPSPAHPRREMYGMGKVKRVVGAGDGRRKRADIVKKVMADKNCSMVEASKYVKEHGLYQKD
jgi:hypothetical protein